jgi:predicted HNH restriction endonuclease
VTYGTIEGEIVRPKAERDPALRKAALKRYGMKCTR